MALGSIFLRCCMLEREYAKNQLVGYTIKQELKLTARAKSADLLAYS